MKYLQVTAILRVSGFVALFAYANLRVLSEGEKLKMVELTSFRLSGNLDANAVASLEKEIKSTEGVRACSINTKAKTACVIYYKDMISESQVASLLTNNSVRNVSKKDLAASGGGCPVHQVGASIDKLLSMLDVRSH